MSFPNIPDIDPCISITLEDAVNLLLTSIALEEVSLSKLMDAETCKILYVLRDCKSRDCNPCTCKQDSCVLYDALLINKSVDETMQNMIKMQMLLQFKLEKVQELIPSTTTTTTTTSTTTTTTCTRTTTTRSCTTTCSTTTQQACTRVLTGTGSGCISNCRDTFYGHTASLHMFFLCRDRKNRQLRYSAEKQDCSFLFTASGVHLQAQCPCQSAGEWMLYGTGRVEKTSCGHTETEAAKFKLTVSQEDFAPLTFQMEVHADTKPGCCHNSGRVQAKGRESTLRLELAGR